MKSGINAESVGYRYDERLVNSFRVLRLAMRFPGLKQPLGWN